MGGAERTPSDGPTNINWPENHSGRLKPMGCAALHPAYELARIHARPGQAQGRSVSMYDGWSLRNPSYTQHSTLVMEIFMA